MGVIAAKLAGNTGGGGGGGGGGTVTTVSVVTANGLSGTVANATTTPAITLTNTWAASNPAGNPTDNTALAALLPTAEFIQGLPTNTPSATDPLMFVSSAFPDAVVVAGAGTGAINGNYTRRTNVGPTYQERPYFVLEGHPDVDPDADESYCIYWYGGSWFIADSTSNNAYGSISDALIPSGLTFVEADTGAAPAPTVTGEGSLVLSQTTVQDVANLAPAQAFSAITGNALDNTSLSDEFALKADESAVTAVALEIFNGLHVSRGEYDFGTGGDQAIQDQVPNGYIRVLQSVFFVGYAGEGSLSAADAGFSVKWVGGIADGQRVGGIVQGTAANAGYRIADIPFTVDEHGCRWFNSGPGVLTASYSGTAIPDVDVEIVCTYIDVLIA